MFLPWPVLIKLSNRRNRFSRSDAVLNRPPVCAADLPARNRGRAIRLRRHRNGAVVGPRASAVTELGVHVVELRQLEYFVAVAEECHFTHAAQRMQVAQSGLSASIRSLERELGAELFLRSTRQVELTEAGRALLVEARRTLAGAAAARDAVAAVQGLLRGSLAIGTLQCICAVDLPPVLARFRRRYPGVEISLRHGSGDDLVEQVRSGRLDVAFTSRPTRCPAGVTARPLAALPLALACGPDHPLAGRPAVGLGELAEAPFVDYAPGWGTRDTVDRILAGAGVERTVALEVNDVHSLLDLVACGLGVALVPDEFRHKRTAARFVPLSGAVPRWETAVATPPTCSAAVQALLLMVDEARTPDPGTARPAAPTGPLGTAPLPAIPLGLMPVARVDLAV
jgi:DNA-binding transcriptional LysR family regulator